MRRMVLYAIIGILFFFAVASLTAFVTYIRPPKIVSDATPEDFGLEYEDISFRTADGITLQAWFVQSPAQNAKTIVVLHGWPADKGNVLPVVAFLAKQYNLFLFDFRALGKSEGKYSTFGAKEQEDLKAALSYLESRGIENVGVWGFSMGGAVALMGAAKDERIAAVAADSSYASWRSRRHCGKIRAPNFGFAKPRFTAPSTLPISSIWKHSLKKHCGLRCFSIRSNLDKKRGRGSATTSALQFAFRLLPRPSASLPGHLFSPKCRALDCS